MKDFCAIADQYIDDVLANKFPTNKWVKLACQRQRDDLARADWEFFFDKKAAENVCGFMELLTHVAGEKGGELIVLEPWEVFFITTLFGWKQKANPKMRRFRRSFIAAGKGNGKSLLSSALSLYMLVADGETGAVCIAAARNRAQANLVFDAAYQMVKANPRLEETFGIKPMKKGIEHPASGSVMKSVCAQGMSLAGMLPSFCSLDETWAHKDRTVVDECERGCAKRANSLISTITHAGENLSCVGYEQYEVACSILSGEMKDESAFACIWSAEGYRWDSEDGWRAANPNWGVSVYPDQISAACDRALRVPALQGIFRSHNCVEWINADTAWIDPTKLVACRERNLSMETFRFWHVGEHEGVVAPDMLRPFVLGLDLASRQDLAAVVYLCLGYVEGKKHYYAWGDYFAPQATVEATTITKYKSAAARGLLTVMPGFSNDYEAIEKRILDRYRRYLGYGAVSNEKGFHFTACAYDDWQAVGLSQSLNKASIKAIAFAKNAKNYSPVMDLFTSLVLEGRFHFPAEDELMLWALSNVRCHRDRNDNLFPNKPDDPDRKIDPAIALLYALKCATADEEVFVRLEAPKNVAAVFDVRYPYTGGVK